MLKETLRDGWVWLRLASKAWANPLDPAFAERFGGRWNPPGAFPTLYLNEDVVTARLNLRAFIAPMPYEPEDLNLQHGPDLIGATLPRQQSVCDAHTPEGIDALSLPAQFPLTANGDTVSHTVCQRVGQRVKDRGLRGLRARSAQSRDGVGRELAWFPASSRSKATQVSVAPFATWYWS
ncbi:MAG: RES family NAD+ phosphorylase [Pseudomonadota bacterium]